MKRQEKFSIRKSHRGAISTCIAVLSLFSLAGLGQEAKAEELVLTSADTSLVEADAFATSEQEEASLELTTLSAPVEEEVAVTGTETIQEVEAELAQAQEDVAQAGQSLEVAEVAQAQAKSDLDQAQAALDAVETSRTETRQVGTKTETVQTGTKTETVQTGTRTEQVQVGTTTENKVQRVTEQVQVGTRTEQVQTGVTTTTKYVGMGTTQVQTGTEIQRVKVGEEEVQVQVGSTYETKVVGTKTELVKVGERTVTDVEGGGSVSLKQGVIYDNFLNKDGLPVTQTYLDALKALANGTGTVDSVKSAIKNGDSTVGGNDLTQLLSADNNAYSFIYNLHGYTLANSDTTTKYDVHDLPYEVRKDLVLFYTAIINDLRSKVGTESLKVSEKSINSAYDLVDTLRNLTLEPNEKMTGYSADSYIGASRSDIADKMGYFDDSANVNGRGTAAYQSGDLSAKGVNLKEAISMTSSETNSDLYYVNYAKNNSFSGNNSARYQTIDQLKYGILTMVGLQLFGFEGNGYLGSENGSLNAENLSSNYTVAMRILGLDGNQNNTVGLDTAFLHFPGTYVRYGYEPSYVLNFYKSDEVAISNPYTTTEGVTSTRTEDVYEERTVDITERVEVPVYRTQVRDVYEDKEVPIYTNVIGPKYETVEEPVYETREVPIYEDKTSIKVVPVETPVYESRQVPVYETIETPIYEEVETPVYETVEVAVAVPQNLLDALSQAKANYDTAQAQTQQARESYKVAQDRLAEVQAKLADLQTPTVEEVPSPTETPVVEEVPNPTETPAVEEVPSPTEAPVTEDKVEPSPAGGAAAAAGQDKPVTSRLTGIGSSERPIITATASGSGYSRVDRHQADKSLPNTGDTGSVTGLIGTALTSLGLVGLKRRRK